MRFNHLKYYLGEMGGVTDPDYLRLEAELANITYKLQSLATG